MPLRILHILSSNFYSGAVSYAVTLGEKQVSEGNQVFMATDIDGLSELFICLKLPISNRSIFQRFKNILFLKKILREYRIDIVHAHSRAASWISYFAIKNTKVALVSTIHGRLVRHSSYKRNDIFGEQIIAICENLMHHLKNEMQFDEKKLVSISNGVNVENLQKIIRSRLNDKRIIISIIGRFNGPKGENIAHILSEVIPSLMQKFNSLYVLLAGGEWDSFPLKGKNAFESLTFKYGERIQYLGFRRDIHQLIVDSDLVVGAGRVAIEGMILGVPVLATGEACCHGILSPSNIAFAIDSNFGDILSRGSSFHLDTEAVIKQVENFIEDKSLWQYNFKNFIKRYELTHVSSEIFKIYRAAIFKKTYPGSVPILMYHKIPESPIESKHRTFVTKNRFEKQLKFFKFRGLSSITFKDYFDFVNGSKPIYDFPAKPFIMTFDDGYEDNYQNMLPLCQKYGFKGVLFLLGDFSLTRNNWDRGEIAETNGLMNINQKKKFVDLGWEIGAHTLTHSDLTKLDDEQAMKEIERSKNLLEENLLIDVISFAYPYGKYNDHIKAMVQKAGFSYGISTDTGGITIEDDHFAIFRVNMFPKETLFQLYKKTSSWYRDYYKRKRAK